MCFEYSFLITPSSTNVEDMVAANMVKMQFDGSYEQDKTLANIKSSSEWRFHCDILKNRPEINAVIHTHSMFATTLTCLHKDIPPFHYMIALTGVDTIRSDCQGILVVDFTTKNNIKISPWRQQYQRYWHDDFTQ